MKRPNCGDVLLVEDDPFFTIQQGIPLQTWVGTTSGISKPIIVRAVKDDQPNFKHIFDSGFSQVRASDLAPNRISANSFIVFQPKPSDDVMSDLDVRAKKAIFKTGFPMFLEDYGIYNRHNPFPWVEGGFQDPRNPDHPFTGLLAMKDTNLKYNLITLSHVKEFKDLIHDYCEHHEMTAYFIHPDTPSLTQII